jgi:predicted MPP superfamily phosphohydrolase
MMKTVIAIEKPDLVVLTGDIVCSKNTAKAWISLSKVCIDAKVPWAVMLGNHDPQDELTWYEDFNNKPKLSDFYGEPVRTKDIPLPNAGNINTKRYPGKIIDGKDLTFKGGSHRTPLTIIPEDTAKDIASKLPEVPVSPSNHYANFSKPVKEKKRTALRSRLPVHYVR